MVELLSIPPLPFILVEMGREKPLIHFVVEPDFIERVDEFRYKNHFPTRAAAIKWLIEFALKQKPKIER